MLVQNRKTKALTPALFPSLHPLPFLFCFSLLTKFLQAFVMWMFVQMSVVRGWQQCPWDAEIAVWTWIRSLST